MECRWYEVVVDFSTVNPMFMILMCRNISIPVLSGIKFSLFVLIGFLNQT